MSTGCCVDHAVLHVGCTPVRTSSDGLEGTSVAEEQRSGAGRMDVAQ